MESARLFDVIVIGSGFGGAVSAMRLSQKGYRVAILEEGKEWKNSDFPRTNWDISKYLWAPLIRCFGIQKITLIRKMLILHGAGVGGGSLVYANTLMRPDEKIFRSDTWPKQVDWVQELRPHFQMAKRMLGVVTNPHLAPNDLAIKELGKKMGVEKTFHPTEVGIFFGKPNIEVPDPYFSGDGPSRTGCHLCGSCMIGCPNGAKNTLDKNYLYFARKWGAQVFSGLRAERITPLDSNHYQVETLTLESGFKKTGPTLVAPKVVFSAGVLGTVKLLLKNRDIYQTLPKLSKKIGFDVRSNGESLLGASSLSEDVNYSTGIAIGAAIHPDENTKIEGVRYPAGSDFMRLLAVPLAGEGGFLFRPIKMIIQFLTRPLHYLRLWFVKDWAKQTVILLVMQSVESKIRLTLGRFGLKGEPQEGIIPSYLPVAQNAAQKLSEVMGGVPQNIFSEVFFQTPATAHILGGVGMGTTPNDGAVNVNHELFHYLGLFVVDASVIPSNLAVNPSLTICALAERFASQFPPNPEKGVSFQPHPIRFSNE